MQFIYEYGLFLAKSATVVFAILLVIGGIVRARSRQTSNAPGDITIRNLSDEYEDLLDTMQAHVLDEVEYKAMHKERERKEKAEHKARKKALKHKLKHLGEHAAEVEVAQSEAAPTISPEAGADSAAHDADEERKPRLYVLNFIGDMEASSVHCLREEITAVLAIADKQDSVLLRLDSPGGMVHSYGHAASQLQRLRDAGIKLVASVDEVAASGGYMMACVANEILAAPFAIIGSIGVVAELPNFHRLLKKFDVDYEQHTAGEFKRTLTMFGENTNDARRKFQQELEDTHALFKQFVGSYRPQLELAKVATGEHWYGSQAKDMHLIDELKTSDAFLQAHYESHDVYAVSYEFHRSWTDKLSFVAQMTLDKVLMRWWQRGISHNFVR